MQVQSFYPKARLYYRTVAPLFEKPKVLAYVLLALSFFTMAFFGIFAIRPTLSTIAELRKRITDQRSVDTRMGEKIEQLRSASVAYQNVKPHLDAIFEALPDKPQSAALLGKLNRTLLENNIDVTILQFSPIALRAAPVASSSANNIGFTISGKASYDDALAFIDLLSRIDRIISIDAIDISPTLLPGQVSSPVRLVSSDILTITIRGQSYVLWERKGKISG